MKEAKGAATAPGKAMQPRPASPQAGVAAARSSSASKSSSAPLRLKAPAPKPLSGAKPQSANKLDVVRPNPNLPPSGAVRVIPKEHLPKKAPAAVRANVDRKPISRQAVQKGPKPLPVRKAQSKGLGGFSMLILFGFCVGMSVVFSAQIQSYAAQIIYGPPPPPPPPNLMYEPVSW